LVAMNGRRSFVRGFLFPDTTVRMVCSARLNHSPAMGRSDASGCKTEKCKTALFNSCAVSIAASGRVIRGLDLLVLFIVCQILHACRIFVAECRFLNLSQYLYQALFRSLDVVPLPFPPISLHLCCQCAHTKRAGLLINCNLSSTFVLYVQSASELRRQSCRGPLKLKNKSI
jgi:hypothetical protein